MTLTPMSMTEFDRFARLIEACCGIHMPPDKLALLSNRLRRRMSLLGLDAFEAYYRRVTAGPGASAELPHFINAVTTHETYFFRHESMWRQFTGELIPRWARRLTCSPAGPRIWSAASSSGEEAYTAAILLLEHLPDAALRRVDILGSDICASMLAKAKAAVYDDYAVSRVPKPLLDRWFAPSSAGFRLHDAARAPVRFRLHDLRDNLDEGGFDLVLLCNVLMYFDMPTKIRAIDVAVEALAPGGHLYVGNVDPIHTLPRSSSAAAMEYVRPGVYQKLLQSGVIGEKVAFAQAGDERGVDAEFGGERLVATGGAAASLTDAGRR